MMPEQGGAAPPIDTKTVLLISRGTMSGGQIIGDCLEKHAGIRCLTREHLLAAVNSYGDLGTRVAAHMAKAAQAYEEFSELRRPYLILMRRALLEYAQKGGCAYFGYSGHLLLDSIGHFVRIRLIAPQWFRIGRTRKHLGCSEAEARDHIHRTDQERARWARWMYGVDIRDPALYDVCLNIERLSVEGACSLLCKVMTQPDFQPTPESIRQVQEAYTATQVLALLLENPGTAELEMGASVTEGVLRIVGPYLPEAERRMVLSIAGSVPGVRKMEYSPGYAPAFSPVA